MTAGRIGLVALIAILLPALTHAAAPAPAREGPSMSDAAFFAALDLTPPALAPVRQAVEKGDLAAARHAFVEHLKTRTSPKWYFSWKDKPAPDARPKKFDARTADKYARNHLVSCSVWHDFKEAIDWNSNPMPDQYKEWTWQLNRHPYWPELGEAYWATGDEKYARAFVAQMTDWVRSQPVPAGSGGGAGSAWRTIETGIRTFGAWPNAFYRFLGSPTFTDDAVLLMVKSFADHAEHLVKHPATGNWLAMESNGLFHIGVLFPEFKAAATWRDTGMKRLYEELEKQVYPDGAQVELASGYHNVSLGSFEMPVRLARLNNVTLPKDYLARMERMFDYDLYISMPNRCMPGTNDSGDTPIGRWMEKAAEYYPARKDFLWAATDGKQGTPPAKTSCEFPWAGYYVLRSGWDPNARYFMLDAGPFGYGHQHEDKLTFIAAAYGRIHVIDPGNFAYNSSQWRKYHIDTFAHNTVLVDGQPQRRRGAKDRSEYLVKQPQPHTFLTTPGFDYAAGVYDEGYGKRDACPAVHRRGAVYVKAASGSRAPGEYWVIVDSLEPTDGKPHAYDTMFHLNADAIDLDAATGRVVTRNKEGSNLAIVPLPAAGQIVTDQAGQEQPYVQGWVKQGAYGVRPIPTPVYRREAAGRVVAAYVLYPMRAGETLPVTAVRPVPTTGGPGVALEIDFGPCGKDLVAVAFDPAKPVAAAGVKPFSGPVWVGGR